MYRMSIILAICVALMVFATGTATADPYMPEHSDAATGAMTLPEGHVTKMPLVCPGGCGMEGGLCGGCQPYAEEMLRNMAVDFCPNCTDPNDLCETCESSVNGAMDMLIAGMQPSIMSGPAIQLAYVEGTLGGDMEGLFGTLMQAASDQKLFGEGTLVGDVMPFALTTEGFSPNTTVYAAVSVDEDTEVAEPLSKFEFPAGAYMVVDYVGPYEGLGGAWMASLAFANMAGIQLASGPCGEEYVSDPESTPEDELLTQIYLPVAGHTAAAEEMDMGGESDAEPGDNA